MKGTTKAGIAVLIVFLLVAGVLYLFMGSQFITKRVGGSTTIKLPEGK